MTGSDPVVPTNGVSGDLCLLTGATGFIGGHLAARLVREGLRVRCLVRPGSDTSLLEALGVELARGDLTDAGSIARAAEDCRYVLHCGARVSDWATVQEIVRVNVTGTRNVLEAAVENSVQRLVHLSTTDVYGYPGAAGVDETYASIRFRNWYAETKRGAEAALRRAQHAHGLQAVILRPATVYGPRSTDVIGEIGRAIRKRNMVLIDGGRAVAGLCYVENLADAAMLALRTEAADGHALNVTDGLTTTWKQFTDDLADRLDSPHVRWTLPYPAAIAAALALEQGYRLLRTTTGLNTPPLLSRQAVHVLGRDQDFSNRKARELLGWAPRIDYATGLEATAKWLRREYFER